MHRRTGFTLIELTAVLVLMALIIAIAAIRLRAPYQAAKQAYWVDRIEAFDQNARQHARRFGRLSEMQIELSSGGSQSPK